MIFAKFEVSQWRRRPLLGPSPCWQLTFKNLLRHFDMPCSNMGLLHNWETSQIFVSRFKMKGLLCRRSASPPARTGSAAASATPCTAASGATPTTCTGSSWTTSRTAWTTCSWWGRGWGFILLLICLLQSTAFSTDRTNRMGFSKHFMEQSDKMWGRGKDLIKYVLKRGGKMGTGFQVCILCVLGRRLILKNPPILIARWI